MTALRPSKDTTRLALKAAFRRTLSQVGGGASFSHATRVGEATLSKYAAAHDGEHFPPVDVVLDLELDAGAPAITTALAAAQGYALVPVEAEQRGPCFRDVAEITRASANLQADLADALADGSVCEQEAKELVAGLDAVDSVLRNLRQLLVHARDGAADEGQRSGAENEVATVQAVPLKPGPR